MLLPYKPSEPIYFGCRFKPYVKQGYMSGGAGYVLSKEAVRRLIEVNKYMCSYQTLSTDNNRTIFELRITYACFI